MSVRWMRSSQVAHGKLGEAIAWAKETAGYVEKKYNLPPVSVFMDMFGTAGVIRWEIDFADLASCEKALSQTLADLDYHKLVEKAYKSELFIDGSTHDHVSKQL